GRSWAGSGRISGAGPPAEPAPEHHRMSSDVADEAAVVEALKRGDEGAFAALVAMYHAALLRLALSYVATREQAEDAVQETWLGVLNGIDRFEGRSSLKTWIFRILVNRAKTKGVREHRSVPFSALEGDGEEAAPS